MNKLQKITQKLKTIPKIKYISLLVIIILAITVSLPTLARYKNRLDLETILNNTEAWDGTVATSYHSGTGNENDPFIISNAKELAFFSNQLKNDDNNSYENTYFKLSNDIIINKGTFNYQDNNLIYNINNQDLYIKEYTKELYDTTEYQNKISDINIFNSLDNFKGYFDGDHYRIYGLYMTTETDEELGLFKNLNGTVKNLYLENTLIYGASATAALASSANNSTIENVLVKGNIIGKNDKTTTLKLYRIEEQFKEKKNESITLPQVENLTKPIKTIKLKGVYTPSIENTLTINNQTISSGEFYIDLGSTPNTDLNLEQTTNGAYTLENLVYEVEYELGITSSIVAKSTETIITNAINKANIYGADEASGLVGIASTTNISNAYNVGNVSATTKASGLISQVRNGLDTTVSKTYNAGTLTAAETTSFISEVDNNSSVTLSNIFNIKEATTSFVTSQDINITNVQDINTSTNSSVQTKTLEEITNKENIKTTLGYIEYVDKSVLDINSNAIWIYENSNLPILYIDDLNDPIAVLHVGTYKWEDIGYELKDMYFTSETAFKIVPKDANETIEASYYIHKEKSALTKTQLDNVEWTKYSDIVTIAEEGYYIIYAKVTDSDENTKYISSEQLIVDLKAPEATITMNDNSWNKFSSDLTNVNIADTTNITVETKDTYSDVIETKYYISNILLTQDELKELATDKWIDYNNQITLSAKGTYIINIKTKDSSNHTAYYNTDYIVFGGFEETLHLGKDINVSYEKLNITSDSTFTYNFIYNDKITYQEGFKTNLITSEPLPVNTKITLVNNNTKQVFTYKVDSSITKYPLNKFIKLGQSDHTKTFNEQEFINEDNKNISIIFDFKNTDITDKTLNAYLEINNSSDKTILSTLKSTIKNVNLYEDKKPSLIINQTNTKETINYNSDSITNIDLETLLSYKTLNNEPIYDSTYEDKYLGIAIKLVDSSSKIVAKKYLKNVEFKVGTTTYSPDNDGIVRIKLSNELATTNTLKITTYGTQTKLETGDYNFVITPFLASDGKYSSTLAEQSINIPVVTTKTIEYDYGFKVEMDSDCKVLYQKDATKTMNINIISSSTLANPNVRVSLYKKRKLTAYDQTYDLIDLQEYTVDTLTEAEANVYYVTTDQLTLPLNVTQFDKRGYELRFDLYDGSTHITSIKKKFIVR